MAKGHKSSHHSQQASHTAENTPPISYATAADAGPNNHGTTPKDKLDERKKAFDDTTEHQISVQAAPPVPQARNMPKSLAQQKQDTADSAIVQGPYIRDGPRKEGDPRISHDSSKPKSEVMSERNGDNSMTPNRASTKANNDLELETDHKSSNGDVLTSTKSSSSYNIALNLDARGQPLQKANENSSEKHQDVLVSGRRAGTGWQRSKIRWAPMNIPLQRRLQTATVLAHGLSIAGLLAIFLFLCAIPILWPILLPYTVYCLLSRASTSGELSHRSERLRRSSVWSLFASYFPARLHRSAELPATRKYIFGYHPHGIISHGAFASFATEALGFSQLFPGITNTLLTLDSNFRVPLYRDYALAMGLASVSRESCENLLTRGGPNNEGMGRAITIVVGGARESLDSSPNSLKLVLKRRKGFVKLAIRTGADLVPVLGFGENDLYEQFDAAKHPRVHKMQLIVKRIFGFTVPLFHARGVFNYDVGLLPYRRPLNVRYPSYFPDRWKGLPSERGGAFGGGLLGSRFTTKVTLTSSRSSSASPSASSRINAQMRRQWTSCTRST